MKGDANPFVALTLCTFKSECDIDENRWVGGWVGVCVEFVCVCVCVCVCVNTYIFLLPLLSLKRRSQALFNIHEISLATGTFSTECQHKTCTYRLPLCENSATNHLVCSSARVQTALVVEADDRQVMTVFAVQPSFHIRHSTNPVS